MSLGRKMVHLEEYIPLKTREAVYFARFPREVVYVVRFSRRVGLLRRGTKRWR